MVSAVPTNCKRWSVGWRPTRPTAKSCLVGKRLTVWPARPQWAVVRWSSVCASFMAVSMPNAEKRIAGSAAGSGCCVRPSSSVSSLWAQLSAGSWAKMVPCAARRCSSPLPRVRIRGWCALPTALRYGSKRGRNCAILPRSTARSGVWNSRARDILKWPKTTITRLSWREVLWM